MKVTKSVDLEYVSWCPQLLVETIIFNFLVDVEIKSSPTPEYVLLVRIPNFDPICKSNPEWTIFNARRCRNETPTVRIVNLGTPTAGMRISLLPSAGRVYFNSCFRWNARPWLRLCVLSKFGPNSIRIGKKRETFSDEVVQDLDGLVCTFGDLWCHGYWGRK